MTTDLLVRDNRYIFVPESNITVGNLFPSGVLYKEMKNNNSLMSFLGNIFQRKEEFRISGPFSDTLELRTSDIERNGYFIFPCKTTNTLYLNEDIVFRNREETLTFLEFHPEIEVYIYDAKRIIDKYFPNDRVEAELVTDFESEIMDRKKTLFLNIITRMKPNKALDVLEKVDEEIFDDRRIDSQLFNVDLEFSE